MGKNAKTGAGSGTGAIDIDEELLTEGLLEDEVVDSLCRQLAPPHRLFLAGLGRGMTPREAAVRAGWDDAEADRIADTYLTCDPIVSRLAAHIIRLRELASMDGEEPALPGSKSIH